MALMQISRRVDYGLRAVIYLADQPPGKCSSIAEISKHQGVPKKFLEKIIQDLARGGLISSKKGATGGYMLTRPADAISFCDVIEAIDNNPFGPFQWAVVALCALLLIVDGYDVFVAGTVLLWPCATIARLSPTTATSTPAISAHFAEV